MMNETLEIIQNRKSVRKYSPEPISNEEKKMILDAAMRAPTAGNMMLYSIIEIEDQRIKDKLAETCDHQPFIASAPWVLLFLADYQRHQDLYAFGDVQKACQEKGLPVRLPGEGDLLLACCDALIAAQTAVIAAESLGIGSCYIGDILENAEVHRDLFHLPRYTLPITLLVFGRPASEKTEKRLSSRFSSEFIVFINAYHRLTSDELIKMNESAALNNFPDLPLAEAVKSLAMNNYFRKFAVEFSVEMDRSAEKWVNRWKSF
jgi:FMN reductase (NADPH)/FMN reductase [NAD(P)H]